MRALNYGAVVNPVGDAPMFDAKSLFEQLARGASAQSAPQQAGGGLADILGQVLQGAGGNAQGAGNAQGGLGGLGDILGKISKGAAPQAPNAAPAAGSGGGLEDMLRQVLGGNAAQGQQGAAPAGGGLGDILGKLQGQLGQGGQGGIGGLGDLLGQVLGQATQGVKEGAGRISDATGAGAALNKAAGGQSTDDLLAQLKDLIANNQLAAGAAAGGLGGLMVGTKTGRGVIGSAAKLGALALIGGLAYKAVQNYQAGKPLITGASALASAPDGTGFELAAQTNESATLLIRVMIAAAAADGRIDDNEKAKIIGSFEQMGGFNDEARAFVNAELANPASAEDLAAAVTSPEMAVQVYTAARVAIETDSQAEKNFLGSLASNLGVDAKLAAHIDATARSVAV
jgi:uncharacterized membrane protein YebE (DUF533 family)